MVIFEFTSLKYCYVLRVRLLKKVEKGGAITDQVDKKENIKLNTSNFTTVKGKK